MDTGSISGPALFRVRAGERESQFNYGDIRSFWKIILEGPPDTPYEKGTFELYCQFGTEYPVKPPTVRFVTPIYHCNINNVGRICHNILDRNYNSLITMREILEAVFGLLMHPEPEDPLDSILAEEYITNKESYDQEARKKLKKLQQNHWSLRRRRKWDPLGGPNVLLRRTDLKPDRKMKSMVKEYRINQLETYV